MADELNIPGYFEIFLRKQSDIPQIAAIYAFGHLTFGKNKKLLKLKSDIFIKRSIF